MPRKDLRTTSTSMGLDLFEDADLKWLDRELKELAAHMTVYRVRTMKGLIKRRKLIEAIRVARGLLGKQVAPAQVVRDARALLRLSQTDFGVLLGVARNSVTRWEVGTSRPRAAMLARIQALVEGARLERGE